MVNHYSQHKICPICLRPFYNRKKWQARGLWPAIIYCSQRCRQQAKSTTKEWA